MHIDIDWQNVDTVLLDMNGTLLDLAFDNYFWQKLVPETYGAQQGISPQDAQEYIRQQYHAVQHTLNWYCLDYWSERLGLDICAMTTAQGPRAVLRDDTVPFLNALKASGKRRILLTNAHPHNGGAWSIPVWPHTLIYYFPPTHLVIPKRISGYGALSLRKRE